jgi:uncharacterized membrane protein YgcG
MDEEKIRRINELSRRLDHVTSGLKEELKGLVPDVPSASNVENAIHDILRYTNLAEGIQAVVDEIISILGEMVSLR